MTERDSHTLILHSGTFKTGSTSIQLFLARNSDRLSAAGATFPKIGGTIRAYSMSTWWPN